MSTNDVPGANPRNNDKLGAGNWAGSASGDGSYVYVEGTENGQVVFEIFDTTRSPVQAYRHIMSEAQFKQRFSYDDKDPKSIKWTWHDRQPFDWNLIIQKGLQPGSHFAFASDTLAEADRIRASMGTLNIEDGDTAGTAAARVAAALGARVRYLSPDDVGRWRRAATHIFEGFQKALDELQA